MRTGWAKKHLKKLDLFVSLLLQPISCLEAEERMGSLSQISRSAPRPGSAGCCDSIRVVNGSAECGSVVD